MRELSDAYARATAAASHTGKDGPVGCPTVHVLVYSSPTALVTRALASGWRADGDLDPSRDIGPPPDLWLPDSTVDVAAVLALAQKSGYPLPFPTRNAIAGVPVAVEPGVVTSIGTSPIVIAGRTPASGPPYGALSWSQALVSAFGTGTGPVAPDPNTSTTGLFAMLTYLLDGDHLVGPALARQRVQITTNSNAFPGQDSAATLCRAGHDPASTSIITSDQVWRLYSAADRLGASCPGGPANFSGWSTARPGDVPVLDHPLVEPTWTWTDPSQRTAAQHLLTWLRQPGGRAALANAYLGAPADCLFTDPTFVATPCVPADPKAARQLYEAARSPGRVLMVIDGSGSMGDPVAGGGSRFTVASTGFVEALGQMGAEDEVALWTFPDRSGPHRKLVDFDAGTAVHRNDTVNALKNVKPNGDTPLYRTIIDGLRAVAGPGATGQTRALVVLTDGQDTDSGMTLQQTRDKVEAISAATGVRLFIVAIGDAACEGGQGLSVLTDGHGGRCLDADLNLIGGTMAELFESLWKGQ